MEKIVEFNLGVGMNQLFPEPVKVIINSDEEDITFDYIIKSYAINEGEKEPHGVILEISNGDTQYMTMDEYKTFVDNRNKLKRQ
jgi:hypothetical protein